MTTKKNYGRGGIRKGAGRKSKWPLGTELKTMRLPACLEKEIFEFAQVKIAQINSQSSTETDGSSPISSQPALAEINTKAGCRVKGRGEASCRGWAGTSGNW